MTNDNKAKSRPGQFRDDFVLLGDGVDGDGLGRSTDSEGRALAGCGDGGVDGHGHGAKRSKGPSEAGDGLGFGCGEVGTGDGLVVSLLLPGSVSRATGTGHTGPERTQDRGL